MISGKIWISHLVCWISQMCCLGYFRAHAIKDESKNGFLHWNFTQSHRTRGQNSTQRTNDTQAFPPVHRKKKHKDLLCRKKESFQSEIYWVCASIWRVWWGRGNALCCCVSAHAVDECSTLDIKEIYPEFLGCDSLVNSPVKWWEHLHQNPPCVSSRSLHCSVPRYVEWCKPYPKFYLLSFLI